jgi:serine/threonine protein kinase
MYAVSLLSLQWIHTSDNSSEDKNLAISSVKVTCVLGKNPRTRTFEPAFVLKKSSKKVLIHFDGKTRNFDRAFLLDKLQSSVKLSARSSLPSIELWSSYLSPDFCDYLEERIESFVNDTQKLKEMLQTLHHLLVFKNSMNFEKQLIDLQDAWLVKITNILNFLMKTLHSKLSSILVSILDSTESMNAPPKKAALCDFASNVFALPLFTMRTDAIEESIHENMKFFKGIMTKGIEKLIYSDFLLDELSFIFFKILEAMNKPEANSTSMSGELFVLDCLVGTANAELQKNNPSSVAKSISTSKSESSSEMDICKLHDALDQAFRQLFGEESSRSIIDRLLTILIDYKAHVVNIDSDNAYEHLWKYVNHSFHVHTLILLFNFKPDSNQSVAFQLLMPDPPQEGEDGNGALQRKNDSNHETNSKQRDVSIADDEEYNISDDEKEFSNSGQNEEEYSNGDEERLTNKCEPKFHLKSGQNIEASNETARPAQSGSFSQRIVNFLSSNIDLFAINRDLLEIEGMCDKIKLFLSQALSTLFPGIIEAQTITGNSSNISSTESRSLTNPSKLANILRLVHYSLRLLVSEPRVESIQPANSVQSRSTATTSFENREISESIAFVERVTASSNGSSVQKALLSSDLDEFWESSGSSGTHWICLQLKADVVADQVGIVVDTDDDSYCPKVLTVRVASSAGGLDSATQIELPSFGSSGGKRFLPVLSANEDAHARFIKIGVKDCGGINCKIRGVIVRGVKKSSLMKSNVSITSCVELALSKCRKDGETDLANSFKWLQVLASSDYFRNSQNVGFFSELTKGHVEKALDTKIVELCFDKQLLWSEPNLPIDWVVVLNSVIQRLSSTDSVKSALSLQFSIALSELIDEYHDRKSVLDRHKILYEILTSVRFSKESAEADAENVDPWLLDSFDVAAHNLFIKERGVLNRSDFSSILESLQRVTDCFVLFFEKHDKFAAVASACCVHLSVRVHIQHGLFANSSVFGDPCSASSRMIENLLNHGQLFNPRLVTAINATLQVLVGSRAGQTQIIRDVYCLIAPLLNCFIQEYCGDQEDDALSGIISNESILRKTISGENHVANQGLSISHMLKQTSGTRMKHCSFAILRLCDIIVQYLVNYSDCFFINPEESMMDLCSRHDQTRILLRFKLLLLWLSVLGERDEFRTFPSLGKWMRSVLEGSLFSVASSELFLNFFLTRKHNALAELFFSRESMELFADLLNSCLRDVTSSDIIRHLESFLQSVQGNREVMVKEIFLKLFKQVFSKRSNTSRSIRHSLGILGSAQASFCVTFVSPLSSKMYPIVSLDLSGNKLYKDSDMISLQTHLSQLRFLQELDLSNNDFNGAGLSYICPSLCSIESLKRLNIDQCRNLFYFPVEMYPLLSTLVHLGIEGNNLMFLPKKQKFSPQDILSYFQELPWSDDFYSDVDLALRDEDIRKRRELVTGILDVISRFLRRARDDPLHVAVQDSASCGQEVDAIVTSDKIVTNSFLQNWNTTSRLLWVEVVKHSNSDSYVDLVEQFLEQHLHSIEELANASDGQGGKAVELAKKNCKKAISDRRLFHKRFKIREGKPEHQSATCLVVFGEDFACKDDRFKLVALKFMKDRLQFEREIRSREDLLVMIKKTSEQVSISEYEFFLDVQKLFCKETFPVTSVSHINVDQILEPYPIFPGGKASFKSICTWYLSKEKHIEVSGISFSDEKISMVAKELNDEHAMNVRWTSIDSDSNCDRELDLSELQQYFKRQLSFMFSPNVICEAFDATAISVEGRMIITRDVFVSFMKCVILFFHLMSTLRLQHAFLHSESVVDIAAKFSAYEESDHDDASSSGNSAMVRVYQESLKRGPTYLHSYPCLLVMPAADRNLKDIIDKEDIALNCKLEAIKRICKDVLNALNVLHASGVIHGDVKPRNLVRFGADYKIIDFDASCRIAREYSGSKHSSAFVPPELVRANLSVKSFRGSVGEQIVPVDSRGQPVAEASVGSWTVRSQILGMPDVRLSPGTKCRCPKCLYENTSLKIIGEKTVAVNKAGEELGLLLKDESRQDSWILQRDQNSEQFDSVRRWWKHAQQFEYGPRQHCQLDAVVARPQHDLWSFGVVVANLLTGVPIFKENREDNLCTKEDWEKLLNWSSKDFDQHFASLEATPEKNLAKNFVSLLLQRDPQKRFLSCSHALEHPFLTGKTPKRVVGQDAEYDVFLSYRVNSDAKHIKLLHRILTQRGLRVYWDAVCIRDGKPWEREFAEGLIASKVFVPFISRKAVNQKDEIYNNFSLLKSDSHCDNVLLEHRLAFELRDRGYIESIFPVGLGDAAFNDGTVAVVGDKGIIRISLPDHYVSAYTNIFLLCLTFSYTLAQSTL